VEPTHGLDPALGLVEVSGEFDPESLPGLSPVDWDGVAAAGQLALGHELVGAGRTMLELARRHALERIQFGRPIASFQAVRHRLAESLVALEAADALLAAAWETPGPDAALAAMAKALAGRSARTVARHCQQLHDRARSPSLRPPYHRARPAARCRQRADTPARCRGPGNEVAACLLAAVEHRLHGG